MRIYNDTFIPYEYNLEDTYKYICDRCKHIKKSLTFLELTKEHLYVRCPLSADYLEIVGEQTELEMLDTLLRTWDWYRPT